MFQKLHNFSKSLMCCHSTFNKFCLLLMRVLQLFYVISSLNITSRKSSSLTTLVAVLLIFCSILRWKINHIQSDSFFLCMVSFSVPGKTIIFYDWISFRHSRHVLISVCLWQPERKYIKESYWNKIFILCHRNLTQQLDSCSYGPWSTR